MALLALGTLLLTRPVVAAPAPSSTAQQSAPPAAGHVDVIEVNGLIDAVTVDFVTHALAAAERDRAVALVLQVDSPGVVAPRSEVEPLLRRIARGAPVPVVVWVGPSGA